MAFLKARAGNGTSPRARQRSMADLVVELTAADNDVRRAAAREIAEHPGAGEATDALVAALAAETVRPVQEALLGALTAVATPAAIDALVKELAREDAWLRNAVIVALQEIGPPAAASVRALLDHADPDLRIAALVTFAGMRDPAAVPWVIAAMQRDTEVNVCATAVETLEQIGSAEAIPALQELARRFNNEPFLVFAAEAVCQRLAGGS
ncbi:HEAT repeat domain-containing protein [Rhodovastum atsumiense]|uniref:HEAT repeat domain-containing protein n=1 Tax=Rhodovastum atsumiense TaxID=504468 RepID=A0A5M6IPD0_9PROT|nr:HEAT repeat domain-containing protein [Rhodovastum atsumiense]KAA5610101.1 HEAT repeat domain-containing protein [Rhodovastum atsumiense]CAH2601427.1 HEAT repeat domain-containing protein [Rhodovastum atsumiense]